jgi:hypothetical protein
MIDYFLGDIDHEDVAAYNRSSANDNGCYLLWLAVTQAAFDAAKSGREAHHSRDFLLHDDMFFPAVANALGFETGTLRAAISKALNRSGKKT